MNSKLKKRLSPVMAYAVEWSVIFSLVAALICHLIFGSIYYDLSILYGALLALISLAVIEKQTGSMIKSVTGAKGRAFAGYAFRYLLYALMLVLGVQVHLNLLAMLVGIMLSKAALILYAVTGKDSP